MPRRPAKRTYSYKSRVAKRGNKGKKVKKFFRLVVLSIVGLLLFSVAFYFYSLTLIIKRPFAKASNNLDYSEASYSSDKPFTVAFVKLGDINDKYSNIQSLYIYHIYAAEGKAVLFQVPVDTVVNYSKRLGEGEVKKLFSMGNFGDESRGVESIVAFCEKHFAVNINGYVVYDQVVVDEFTNMGVGLDANELPSSIKLLSLLKVPNLFEVSRNSVMSDLSSIEALKIIGDTKTVTLENYLYNPLTDESLNDTKGFDDFWQDKTQSFYVSSQRPSVSLLNSTNTPGLASWGARFVKNTGGVVINIDNESYTSSETLIYTDIQDSQYLNYLVEYFNVEKVLPVEDYKENPFLAKRSDYLIILGENNSLRL